MIFATILMIDDVQDHHETVQAQLQDERYQLISAHTEGDGLDAAVSQKPDLILLNATMGGVRGYAICEMLKSDPRTTLIPVIILTRLRDVLYRIRAIEVGADDFLTFPNNREELVVRIRNLVRLKREQEQLEIERGRLKLLFSVSQAVSRKVEVEPLLRTLLRDTGRALGAQKGLLLVTDDDGKPEWKVTWRPPKQFQTVPTPDPAILETGFLGSIWSQQFGNIIDDVSEDFDWNAHRDLSDVGSAIGLPLIYGADRMYGVFLFTHEHPSYFDTHHLTLLTLITHQVTAGLHKARLYALVRAQRERLATILDSTSDAIITTDDNNNIDQFNRAAEILFNQSAATITGRPITTIPALSTITATLTQRITAHHDIPLPDNRILNISSSPITESGAVAVVQDVTERRLREQVRYNNLRDVFGRYIDSALLDHAIDDLQQTHFAIVMFADLRDHTQLVSNCTAETVINTLNHFFDEMTRIIYAHEGTIIDLIGDELEVTFNIPFPQPDMFERAINTAIAMQKRFRTLQIEWEQSTGVQLGLGIGFDVGDVIIGQVGSERRKDLALVGLPVNTAHRMVSLAQDKQIVIPITFYEQLIEQAPHLAQPFESLGERPVKGLPTPIELFRLTIDH